MQSKLSDIIKLNPTFYFAVSSYAQEISLLLQCKSIDWPLCSRQHCEVKD